MCNFLNVLTARRTVLWADCFPVYHTGRVNLVCPTLFRLKVERFFVANGWRLLNVRDLPKGLPAGLQLVGGFIATCSGQVFTTIASTLCCVTPMAKWKKARKIGEWMSVKLVSWHMLQEAKVRKPQERIRLMSDGKIRIEVTFDVKKGGYIALIPM